MKSLIIESKTHGTHEVFMDDADFEVQSKFKWCIKKHLGNWYARRRKGNIQVTLHQEIMGIKEGKVIDHKDGNGLNCTRENMRHCTNQENSRNRIPGKASKTGISGVYFEKESGKYRVALSVDRKKIHIGRFKDLTDATIARNEAALKYFGEFARLHKVG